MSAKRTMRDNSPPTSDEDCIARHDPIAKHIARRFRNGGSIALDWDDLLQEARIGLLRAGRQFNPEYGCAFSTFAFRVCRNHLMRVLLDEWRQNGRIDGTDRYGNFRDPLRAVRLGHRKKSEDDPIQELAAPDEGSDETLDRHWAIKALFKACRDDRDKRIVGAILLGQKDNELGRALGISRERVRQLKVAILERVCAGLRRKRAAANRMNREPVSVAQ